MPKWPPLNSPKIIVILINKKLPNGLYYGCVIFVFGKAITSRMVSKNTCIIPIQAYTIRLRLWSPQYQSHYGSAKKYSNEKSLGLIFKIGRDIPRKF